MTKEQGQVKDFMQKYQQQTPEKPAHPAASIRALRVKLLLEEVFELAEASGVRIEEFDGSQIDLKKIQLHVLNNKDGDKVDLVGVADALADIDYVNLGAAVAYGIDLEPFQTEVHRSNMTKLWKLEEISGTPTLDITRVSDSGDGRVCLVKNEDGKVIKSPSYSPADLKSVMAAQLG